MIKISLLCVLLDRQLICSSFSLKATKVPLLPLMTFQRWMTNAASWHYQFGLKIQISHDPAQNCVLINVHKVHCFLVNKYNMIKSNIHVPPDRNVICHALQKQNIKKWQLIITLTNNFSRIFPILKSTFILRMRSSNNLGSWY